ncbi:MAG: FAD-dependent oxidoreductase [Rhodovibrionaceae bacterium]
MAHPDIFPDLTPKWSGQAVQGLDHGLPVLAEPDVVVIGGGAAGLAAATSAAEKGLSVLLVERYGFCGGNAVAGFSGTLCGLYYATERAQNRPEQAVFGFAERFRQAMIARGGLTDPQQYGKTWTVTHDPLVWREVGDAFLEDAGVKVLYHSLLVGVIREDDALCGVVVAGKAGLTAIHACIVIDASGDGDVVHRAGLPFTVGDGGKVQNPTMIFRLGGVDVARFTNYWGADTICSPDVSQMLIESNGSGYALPRAKIWIFATPRPGQLLVNATRLLGRDGRDLYPGDPEDLTEAEFVGRAQVREYARFLKDKIPGCAESYVLDTGVQAGVRQSRSIAGRARLSNADVVGRRKRKDGIVRCPWPIELHAGDKPKLEWLLDDYYEIPFDALIPAQGQNLIAAGRCLSAEHEALASARVTAQCFGYGQAAGLAAVESLRTGRSLRELSGEELRSLLNSEGARLDD